MKSDFTDEDYAEQQASHSAVYMLRTVQQHHVQLGIMADQKANILVGVCLVIVTICFSQVGRGAFPPALGVWGIFSIIAAALGIFAVMPRTPSAAMTVSPTSNMLFCGIFARLSEKDFTDKIMATIQSDDLIYRAMIRDIHQIGQVLHLKKFRYIGYSYRVFVIGLLVSLITMILDVAGAF